MLDVENHHVTALPRQCASRLIESVVLRVNTTWSSAGAHEPTDAFLRACS